MDAYGLVERWVAYLNTGEVDILDECLSPAYVDHDPVPGATGDADGMRATTDLLVGGTLRVVFCLEDCFARSDWVAYRLDGVVTSGSTMSGIFRLGGVGIFRIDGGLLSERWGRWTYRAVESEEDPYHACRRPATAADVIAAAHSS